MAASKAKKSKTSKGKSSSKKSSESSSKKVTIKTPAVNLALKVVGWTAVFIVCLVLVDFALQHLNYHSSVALVNGDRVPKSEFHLRLEETYGTTIADQMIDEALIYQEAQKLDVTVSEDEIDAEITELEDSYGGKEQLQQELDNRNISDDRLRHQIETTLLVERIVGEDIEITEDEKKEFYEEYKDVIIPDNEDPTYEEAEEQIEQILREQKISQEVQSWLLELREDATIENNVEDPKGYSVLMITRTFVTDLPDIVKGWFGD